MMRELDADLAAGDARAAAVSAEYPYVFVGRRAKHVVNGTGQDIDKLARDHRYNPAFMHPSDMAALDLAHGQLVEIRSAHGAIDGVVEADSSLRRGVVSMTHAFGRHPADPKDARGYGANTNELLSLTAEFDPITGMPRMGAVPVRIVARDRVGVA